MTKKDKLIQRLCQLPKQMQYLAHKPHPSSIIKEKALKDIVNYLTENKLI